MKKRARAVTTQVAETIARPIDSATGEPSERRKDPKSRLRFAYGHLPAKRAFREAAVALRAMIRDGRRNGDPTEDALSELYRLATVFGLVHPPETERQETNPPAVADAVRWGEVEQLKLPYDDVGYDKLILLNKTDKKWLVDAWGEPKAHRLPVVRRKTSAEKSKPAVSEQDRWGFPVKGPASGGSEQAEASATPTEASIAAALAPKPRHTYEGGAVPVPEGSEDAVYDLMERLAGPRSGKAGRARARLLRRALIITGFGEDG